MNSATLSSADKTMHLKIVLIALIASTIVAIVGINARVAPNAAPPVYARPMHDARHAMKSAD
jgi:hypothetical protein